MENAIAKSANLLQYDQLSIEAKLRVDRNIEELKNADSKTLLTYGMEAQAKVTEYANSMLTKISSGNQMESIDDIISEVLDVTKPFMTASQRKNWFQRIFGLRNESDKIDRSIFADKIEKLVDTIDDQIGRLIADNIMYDGFIELLIKNIDSINESIIALEKYISILKTEMSLEESGQDVSLVLKKSENNNLFQQFERKLNMFYIARQESMQVAVSGRIIQNNNVTLSDRLQTLLVVAVPILQNQILLKASMADTQKGLDICDKVAESVDTAMKQNSAQLKELTLRLGISSDLPIDSTAVADMSKSILSIAEELKTVNGKAKSELSNMQEQINQSDKNLTELFNQLSFTQQKKDV